MLELTRMELSRPVPFKILFSTGCGDLDKVWLETWSEVSGEPGREDGFCREILETKWEKKVQYKYSSGMFYPVSHHPDGGS